MNRSIVSVLTVLVVWCTNAVWAATQPDTQDQTVYSAEAQKEIGDIYMASVKRGTPSSVEACEAAWIKADALLAAQQAAAEDEWTDLIIRRIKMPIAKKIYGLEPTAERKATLLATLKAVCDSPRYEGHRMDRERPAAEYDYAVLSFWDETGKELIVPKETVSAHVTQMMEKYSDTGLSTVMSITAGKIAAKAGLSELEADAKSELAKDLTAPGVIDTLIADGKPPVFTAELLTLEGKTLKLPEDTRGQVVVIDFWATWCGPCKKSMPHFKRLAEQYKDKGVLFIGEACDGREAGDLEAVRELVRKYTTDHGYLWTHCASGGFSPAALRYGINSIPHVMVIGKDGKIFKYQARGREEAAINAALKTTSS